MKAPNQAARLLVTVAALLPVTADALPATAQTFDGTVAGYKRGHYATVLMDSNRLMCKGWPLARKCRITLR